MSIEPPFHSGCPVNCIRCATGGMPVDPGPMTDEEWEPFARATGIEPPNDSMPDEDVEALAVAVGIHPRHVRFIVERAEQRMRERIGVCDAE